MALNVRIVSGSTNYYLSGTSNASYAGTGTPWTAQATTPYELARNDVTGDVWAPTPPQQSNIYSGIQPFRNGQSLAYQSYPNKTELIGIQARGTTHDNAVALLRQLRNVLVSGIAVLAVQPNGATNTVFWEIISGSIQETSGFCMAAEGAGFIRATITLVLAPWGTGSAMQTIINAATFTNNGADDGFGGAGNFVAFTDPTGDSATRGQPCSITMSGGDIALGGVKTIYLATAQGLAHAVIGEVVNTTSTTGVAAGSMSASFFQRARRYRVVVRVTTANALLQLRHVVSTTNSPAVSTGPWVTVGAGAARYIDLGGFVLDEALHTLMIAEMGGAVSMVASIEARSTTGAAATGTVEYGEVIVADTWCKVITRGLLDDSAVVIASGTDVTLPTRAKVLPGQIAIARAAIGPKAYRSSALLYGTMPVACTSRWLYCAWDDDGVHDSADQITITVKNVAQYATLAGAG